MRPNGSAELEKAHVFHVLGVQAFQACPGYLEPWIGHNLVPQDSCLDSCHMLLTAKKPTLRLSCCASGFRTRPAAFASGPETKECGAPGHGAPPQHPWACLKIPR